MTGPVAVDVLVVGGGPAGSAAAIACASNGLKVLLCEREAFPRERPGEALHPGVDAVLEQLGVAERLDAATGARFEGVEIDWAGESRFEPFGADANGPWRGRQVRRSAFDSMLLDRAAEAGCVVRQPCRVVAPTLDGSRVVGAVTDAGPVISRVLIDASGPARWLPHKLRLPSRELSPTLVVRYGYARGECPDLDACPRLSGDETGWTWTARVAPGRYQWVRLDLATADRPRDWRPDILEPLVPEGPSRGAEMSWRLSQASGPGWLLAGDTAALLDPTSSHGVLKALMSGYFSGQTTTAILSGGNEEQGLAAYRHWVEGWFTSDLHALRTLYGRLGVDWVN